MKTLSIGFVVCTCSVMALAAPNRTSALSASSVPQEPDSEAVAEGDIVTVKGTGTGETEEVALKDAYRDAVETAVGLYVDAEQMAQNDAMIQDEILTQSNAYIENCDVLSKETKNGLVKIKILAKVRKQALTKKIKGAMKPKTFKLGGGLKKYHAQTTTQAKKSADGAALLAKALKGVDLKRQLIDVSLASAEGFSVDDSTLNAGERRKRRSAGRSVGSEDANVVEMAYLFKFEINQDRYFKEFLPKLMQVLDQVSEKEPTLTNVSVAEKRQGKYESAHAYSDPKARFQSGNLCDAPGGILDRLRIGACLDPKLFSIPSIGEVQTGTSVQWGEESLDVFVISEANSTMTLVKGKQYSLSSGVAAEVGKWLNGGDSSGRATRRRDRKSDGLLRYQVAFLDEDGKEITASTIELGDNFQDKASLENTGFGNYWSRAGERRNYKIWFVSPYMGCSSSAFYKWFSFKLPKEDLPKVDSIKVELAE